MLTELAEQVQPQPQAALAWAKASQVRRRRAVIGAAVAVLLVATTMALVQLPRVADNPVGTPTPAPTGMARIDRLPATIPVAADAAPYWPPNLNPPANAPTFQAAPLSHAVLLFQPDSAGPIYAYGEGSINEGSGNGSFQWVRLDVSLSDTPGADGKSSPLDQGSLGPMGHQAAFAQRNEVVIVDFREGTVQRIPLPGLNEDLTWLPDGRHLFVTGCPLSGICDSQTWLIATDHVIGPVAVPGYDVTPLVGDALGLTTMSASLDIASTPAERLIVSRYDDEGRAEVGHFEVDLHHRPGVPPEPPGTAWSANRETHRAGRLRPLDDVRDFVVVVDDRPEAVTHVLDLGTFPGMACCAVMGWENGETVLVLSDQEGLLRWHLPTGAVTRLTASAQGSMSVAPTGCNWTVHDRRNDGWLRNLRDASI